MNAAFVFALAGILFLLYGVLGEKKLQIQIKELSIFSNEPLTKFQRTLFILLGIAFTGVSGLSVLNIQFSPATTSVAGLPLASTSPSNSIATSPTIVTPIVTDTPTIQVTATPTLTILPTTLPTSTPVLPTATSIPPTPTITPEPTVADLKNEILNANIVLTGPEASPSRVKEVEGFFQDDPAYQALARLCLKILIGRKFINPVHLDTINGKYKQLVDKSASYLQPERYNDEEKLKEAILNHWNEQRGYPFADSFEQVVR